MRIFRDMDENSPFIVKALEQRIKDIEDHIETLLTPPKREWQGLTDEQIRLMAHNDDDGDWNDLKFRDIWHSGYLAGFRSAEAKLRERNA